MAFYILRSPAHVRYYVEVYEAESEDDAVTKDGVYIGYVDEDWDGKPFSQWSGPFATEAAARESDVAWTQDF